jgi:hypothetical protein
LPAAAGGRPETLAGPSTCRFGTSYSLIMPPWTAVQGSSTWPTRCVEHSHPHVQCSLVEDGVFDTIAGVTRRLGRGDSFLVPSNALHGAVAVEAGLLVDVFSPMREDFVGRDPWRT